MAIAYTVIGSVENITDTSITLVALDTTRYQFVIDSTTINELPEVLPETVIVTYSGVYSPQTVATIIASYANTILGEVHDITSTQIIVKGRNSVMYTFITDGNTQYSMVAPTIGAPVQVTYQTSAEGLIASVIVCIYIETNGMHQVTAVPQHISDSELSFEKNEGEYVYPADWNGLLRAVQVLNDNAIILADLIHKHNTLDTETLSLAQATIIDGSVLARHIVDKAVISEKIADNAIKSEHIADKNVTIDKVADDLLGRLLTTQISKKAYDWRIAPSAATESTVRQTRHQLYIPGKHSLIIYRENDRCLIFNTQQPYRFFEIGYGFHSVSSASSYELKPAIGTYACAVDTNGTVTDTLQTYKPFSAFYPERGGYYPSLPGFGGTSPFDGCGIIALYLEELQDGYNLHFVYEQRTADKWDGSWVKDDGYWYSTIYGSATIYTL